MDQEIFKRLSNIIESSPNPVLKIINKVIQFPETPAEELFKEVDLFELCDILRLKLTTYKDAPFNQHVMNDGSGYFIGCVGGAEAPQ